MTALLLADSPLARALDNPSLAARVIIDINPRARRISLRVDPTQGCIVLVRPRRASDRAVADFVISRQEWIDTHLQSMPPRIAFLDGVVIPYLGLDYILRFRPHERGGVWKDDDRKEIVVTGRAEHSARRLRDWLKNEARAALSAPVHAMAGELGKPVIRLTVRDTRSRWGSCSRDGKLSFSWRLIFAPHAVLKYVAAHEVAHLKHMNHSRAFWSTVETLLTSQSSEPNWKSARQWLRRGGAALHRYG
jgi:predicted metal-dependent hydrolase